MTNPRITLAMLRGACKEQRAIFKAEWPKGVDVTIENVQRAIELGLDLEWGTKWFTPEALAEYQRQREPLRAEYERQIASLWAEYQRQIVPLRAEYDWQTTPLWAEYARDDALPAAEYERQIVPLWAEYERQREPLLENYYLRHATLWVEAFLASQGGTE